jgi:mannose-6-phosphate isomerase
VSDKIFKLEGKVMHYAWGGYDFIPQTLGIQNTERKPFAEYWLGVHPLAPTVIKNGDEKSLASFIESDPENILSSSVYSKFQTLPFLLKVQDVREVLSIQVHPNKQQAEIGFDNEDKAGIPINALHRNYKDKNHKPEMAVAVSKFWLLHGFRQLDDIREVLNQYSSFRYLADKFESEGLEGLYRFVMTMPQQQVDDTLAPVITENIQNFLKGYTTKEDPAFWIARYYNNEPATENIDRGIFSMFLLNIVKLNPGESIFQDAGILHAYLEGYNVELMSNSDNVLRGGLTLKHIDVDELLKQTAFASVTPNVLKGEKNGIETNYKVPVDDFGISKLDLINNDTHNRTASTFEIHVLLNGTAEISEGTNTLQLKKGDSYGIVAGTTYSIRTNDEAVIYRAFVP